MASEGRTAAAVAAPLESASFVRIVTRADGDALAAAGLLASALSERETPFQVTVAATVGERTDRARADGGDDREATLVIGAADVGEEARSDALTHLETTDRPATLEAWELARELGHAPEATLALAGAAAAGVEPGAGETEWLLESALETGDLEGRPGVAIPTADPVDGLAHTTGCRAPWSGSLESTRESLEALSGVDLAAALDDESRTRVGSLVALDTLGLETSTATAADAVGRFLRPYAMPDAPFETVGGYADVLEATARTEPGTGVALAMGHPVAERALEVWRDHGRRTHAALDAASTGRYDGLFVVGIDDGPVESVARLAAAYRSPEPVVLAIGEGAAAVATLESQPLGGLLEAIARDLDADYDVGRRRGLLRYDADTDDSTIIETTRGAL